MGEFKASLGVIQGKLVLDIGSQNVNGTYREIFEGTEYLGIDSNAGVGVDLVIDPLLPYPFPDKSFDIIVCGQVLEHAYEPWRIIEEISRLLKDGGKCCIIAPWKWDIHRYPVDCWRILPDGLRYQMEKNGIKVIMCEVSENDTVGIGEK